MSPVEHACRGCARTLLVVPDGPVRIGRPFLECVDCGTLTPCPAFDEWSLMSARDRLRLVGSGAAYAIALGLLPALLYALVGIVRGSAAPPLHLVLAAALGVALATGIWAARLADVVRRSRRRMTDPMYLAKLAEFGMQAQEPEETGSASAGSSTPV